MGWTKTKKGLLKQPQARSLIKNEKAYRSMRHASCDVEKRKIEAPCTQTDSRTRETNQRVSAETVVQRSRLSM